MIKLLNNGSGCAFQTWQTAIFTFLNLISASDENMENEQSVDMLNKVKRKNEILPDKKKQTFVVRNISKWQFFYHQATSM